MAEFLIGQAGFVGGSDLRARKSVGPISIVSIALVVVLAAFPAAALDRSRGDFWTYTMSMGVSEISANGTTTYTYVDQDRITVGGTSYDVNVMKISGGASGSVDFLGFEASLTLGGYVYETQSGMALVKNDLFMWTNLTFGTGSFQIVSRAESEIQTTYSPALISGFSPSSTGPGDSWSETVTETMTTTNWVNGTMQGPPDTKTGISTYNFVVASAKEIVTTPAGKFESLKITATDIDGNSVVYWWSADAKNFVKEDTYEKGSPNPVVTLLLKDYNAGSSVSFTLIVAMGGIVLLVALVVLALVMLKMRKPLQPSPGRSGMKYERPPSPPRAPPGQ